MGAKANQNQRRILLCQLSGKRNAVDIRQIKIHQCGSKRFAILQCL